MVNDLGWLEWLCCCCCKNGKHTAFEQVQTKMQSELDLAEMVQTLRMVKFMRSL